MARRERETGEAYEVENEILGDLAVVGEPNSGSLTTASEIGIDIPQDAEIDRLIQLFSKPTQALTHEEYRDSIRKRQDAVNKHLFRGGAETLRRFFERIRYLEERQSIKLDLSMLDVSDHILSGLYLPGANLEKLILTGSDITGSELTGANLSDSIATKAILRGVVAAGANFTNAIMPNADLSGGRFMGCIFLNTVMTDVILDEDTNFAGAWFVGSYLGTADLSRANTVGAIFRGLKR